MKYPMILISILLLISCSEKDTPVNIKPPKDCKVPYVFIDPNTTGIPIHFPGRLSPDGKKMFFSRNSDNIFILDLKSLTVFKYDLASILPANIKLFGASADACFWCPYDNNMFAASVILSVDTIGDGSNYYTASHLIKASLDGKYFELITPYIFGKKGAPFGVGIDCWFSFSKFGDDYFNIIYKISFYGKPKYEIYNTRSHSLTETTFKNVSASSSDGKYYFRSVNDTSQKGRLRFFVNQIELNFNTTNNTDISWRGSISSDGKLLAINAKNYNPLMKIDSCRLEEIWIIDIEKFMQNPVKPVPVKIINLKEKFCMFSYGAVPTFISNNTMAVSMFKAGDTFSYLHEIDINGNYIRQLTFVP